MSALQFDSALAQIAVRFDLRRIAGLNGSVWHRSAAQGGAGPQAVPPPDAVQDRPVTRREIATLFAAELGYRRR